MQTTEILQIINMVDSEVNLPNNKLIAQVKLTPSARGGEDKRGLFQAAHFKQSGLCTPLQLNSTINTQQKNGPSVVRVAPCGLQSHLSSLVNFLDRFDMTELCSITAVEHAT